MTFTWELPPVLASTIFTWEQSVFPNQMIVTLEQSIVLTSTTFRGNSLMS
jgi:hypothetical protein